MKHLKTVFNALRALFLVLFSGSPALFSQAQVIAADSLSADPMDSVEVSLLTGQPHDEVYRLYGHTAIRYHDFRKSGKLAVDAAFNYGVFDFNKPHFVLRFVFGLTDYELGAYPYKFFEEEYKRLGCQVTEQVLNLTGEEKQALRAALSENLQPENRVYRYNYFYNNCTTKARDIIERCISGKLEYAGREDYTPSYREMVHVMTRNNPWARWGNDLLLGIKADRPTTLRQQEFLPYNLLYDFDHAQIYANGTYRPLVKERRIAVPSGVQLVQQGFPLTPSHCAFILAAAALVLFALQWKKRQAFLLWDLLLMITAGAVGIVLTLMLFSQHPTVSLNLQIILFNPVHWLFLWPVVRSRTTHYWYLCAALCVLFLVGGLFQSYAEGIWSLALCLLLQSAVHIIRRI